MCKTPAALLGSVFLMSACVNNLHPGGASAPVQPPTTLVERCRDNPPAAGAGLIRVDSKEGGLAGCPVLTDGGHNILVYDHYDNKMSGQRIEICAEEVLPAGWFDVYGAQRDPNGCDGTITRNTYDNVRFIQKN